MLPSSSECEVRWTTRLSAKFPLRNEANLAPNAEGRWLLATPVDLIEGQYFGRGDGAGGRQGRFDDA
ncbi:hypothetical protein NPN17_24090, partial [Vibrio parahaemolyticus]|nr:hypothetical protein [Vibrio parahaemolyticus]